MSEDGSDDDFLDDTSKGVSTLKAVMDIAGKSPELTDAGENIAKSAKTITSLINNCLLPIAVANFAFEKGRAYFETKFQQDLEQATAHIRAEDLVEPKALLAAAVLQGLTFSHDDENLKSLFLSLLSTAMNGKSSENAHPAFVEIIKQLSSLEAGLLNLIFRSSGTIPIVQLRREATDGNGFDQFVNHVLNLHIDANKPTNDPQLVRTAFDNWERLGLIRVKYDEHFVDAGAYSWVNNNAQMILFRSIHPDRKINFERGILRITDFGTAFKNAVT